MPKYTLLTGVYLPTENGGEVVDAGKVVEMDEKSAAPYVERGSMVAGEVEEPVEAKPVVEGDVVDEFDYQGRHYEARQLDGRNGQVLFNVDGEAFIEESAYQNAKQSVIKDELAEAQAQDVTPAVEQTVVTDNAPLVQLEQPQPAGKQPTPEEIAAALQASEPTIPGTVPNN